MGLVDRQQRHAGALDHLVEPFVVEPLRRDVQHAEPAGTDLVHHFPIGVGREGRIEPSGGDAPCGQSVDLILHQSDQRRHDQRDAGQRQRRQLVAKRLPAAGRKHGCRGTSGQEVFDHLPLTGPEVVETERFTQKLSGIGVLHGCPREWCLRGGVLVLLYYTFG
jgi:hypothetical protein